MLQEWKVDEDYYSTQIEFMNQREFNDLFMRLNNMLLSYFFMEGEDE